MLFRCLDERAESLTLTEGEGEMPGLERGRLRYKLCIKWRVAPKVVSIRYWI